jgi:cell division inhibitor SepF
MGFLGLVDTEEDQQVIEPARTREVTARPTSRRDVTQTGVTLLGSRTNSIEPIVQHEDEERPSYNIVTLQPRSYSEARKVGEHYREGNPVIINLDDMEEGERKRLVDFASGLVFGLHGRIERLSLKVFLLSPANVSVSSEEKSAAQASFFNQS